MQSLNLSWAACPPAGSPPQFVREAGAPTKAVFSELEPGNRQEMHSAPSVGI